MVLQFQTLRQIKIWKLRDKVGSDYVNLVSKRLSNGTSNVLWILYRVIAFTERGRSPDSIFVMLLSLIPNFWAISFLDKLLFIRKNLMFSHKINMLFLPYIFKHLNFYFAFLLWLSFTCCHKNTSKYFSNIITTFTLKIYKQSVITWVFCSKFCQEFLKEKRWNSGWWWGNL